MARVREDDAHDKRITQAWWTAAMTMRKLPDLKTLLAKREVQPAMNVAQMRTTLQAIAEGYKLKLRRGKKKKGKKR